ncbi:MAG: HAMP domain-containing sensor histidine kinase [Vicinamibacterales bacterium]|nr:HAMP domain-containing sensor histidine kinase [Vicinamibacterales bacterium]
MNTREAAALRRSIVIFSLVTIAFALTFIGVNLLRGFPNVAAGNAGLAAVLAANLLVLERTGRLHRAAVVGLNTMMVFILLSLPTLGIAALVWAYGVPVIAFFMIGLRAGWWFMGSWIVALAWVLEHYGLPDGMTTSVRLEMMAALALVATLASLSERLRQRYLLEVRNQARRAEEAAQAKDRFLAHFSHELRTPLNAILGFSQILSRRQGLPDDLRPHLDRIHESGLRLLGLIESILEYARLETGDVAARLQDVQLLSVCRDLKQLVEPQVVGKGARYECRHDPALAVRADPGLLRQALLCLLTDSLRTVRPGDALHVQSARTTDGQTIEIRVHDDAAAKPPAQHDAAVASATTTLAARRDEGFGLAIVMRIIEDLHGGKVTVARYDSGATDVRLALPAAPDHATPPAAAAAADAETNPCEPATVQR